MPASAHHHAVLDAIVHERDDRAVEDAAVDDDLGPGRSLHALNPIPGSKREITPSESLDRGSGLSCVVPGDTSFCR